MRCNPSTLERSIWWWHRAGQRAAAAGICTRRAGARAAARQPVARSRRRAYRYRVRSPRAGGKDAVQHAPRAPRPARAGGPQHGATESTLTAAGTVHPQQAARRSGAVEASLAVVRSGCMRRTVDLVRHMCTPRPEVIGECSEHASVAKQALERALRRTCCTSLKPPSRALQQCPWAPKRPLDCAAALRTSTSLLARN